MPSEGAFRHLLELRQQGERLEPARVAEALGGEERQVVFESLLASGESQDRDRVQACYLALKRRKLERERETLQAQIQAADRNGDASQLAQLLEGKAKVAKELAQFGQTQKNSAKK